ncbi:MAG TPA: hypothetical protein VMU41_07450, partial [Candidatus Binataceae bacterium]|nr:hypothetical protein [Candidatus Binataceae bacterium]
MHARVIIVGQAGKIEQLTYVIPPALDGRVACGHRVLVPMRSRRMTGLVVELGEDLEAGSSTPKAILELLESRPLFDRAHLQLIEFLASYYMAPIGEAYRSVIPAIARVESRRLFKPGRTPDALAHATLTTLERSILDSVAKRPLSARQIRSLGNADEADSALARLAAEGLIEASDATRGRHRTTALSIVRLSDPSASTKMRGRVQREIQALLSSANSGGIALTVLEDQLPGARSVLRTMVKRGLAEIITDPAAGALDVSSEANQLR